MRCSRSYALYRLLCSDILPSAALSDMLPFAALSDMLSFAAPSVMRLSFGGFPVETGRIGFGKGILENTGDFAIMVSYRGRRKTRRMGDGGAESGL